MEDLQRKLPFALEAEQSVLGSVLINPECITEITGIISEEDFYLEEHRSIFAAMRQHSRRFSTKRALKRYT